MSVSLPGLRDTAARAPLCLQGAATICVRRKVLMTGYREVPAYERPPIEEAILQLMLAEPAPWTVASPGLAFSAIEATYPTSPEQQQELNATVGIDENSGAGVKIEHGAARFLFKDAEFRRFAILSDRVMCAGSRAPYTSWPELRHRVVDLAKSTSRIYGEGPLFAGVSIRYINRVIVPEGQMDTDEYFNTPVVTANGGKAPVRSFMSQVESHLGEGRMCRVVFASLQPDDRPGSHFLLDLDFGQQLEGATLDQALEVADGLKNEENLEFESRITDSARRLFANGQK